MRCSNCSTENNENRKFCGECGHPIGIICPQCGFQNSSDDKYCGGCGLHFMSIKTTAHQKGLSSTIPNEEHNRYSDDDISELIDRDSSKKSPPKKRKELKDADEISQDLLDKIFNADDSETEEG